MCQVQAVERKASETKDGRLQRPNDSATTTYVLWHCDLFGPFVMKDSKKEAKRYGTLYTCQARSYTLRLCTF